MPLELINQTSCFFFLFLTNIYKVKICHFLLQIDFTIYIIYIIQNYYSHFGCYNHNVLAAVSSGFLQLLFVTIHKFEGISNNYNKRNLKKR